MADRLVSADVLSAAGLHASWTGLVEGFLNRPEGLGLKAFLAQRLAEGATVYPPDPWRALRLTALDAVRVVIVGQDPYHGPGQAEGLAFSVAPGMRVPPSLRNIHREVWRDVGPSGVPMPQVPQGSLVSWAQQGVLLLNACLTVEDGRPGSHADRGWEVLTQSVLTACAQPSVGRVFFAWGGHAQRLVDGLNLQGHLILRANHPSPLSASRGPIPFKSCGHFSQANRWLAARGHPTVNWLAPWG